MKKMIVFIIFSLGVSAFSQNNYDFNSLYSQRDFSEAMPRTYSDNLPQEKKYGVSYSLRGIIKVEEGRAIFYTSDGRIFELDMKVSQAAKYEGKPVEIYAKAVKRAKT
ncbi:MAG: hypothetical protein Fur0012_00970 [Elusimicrobiota bacterium]